MDRVHSTSITIPTGTAESSPYSVAFKLEDATLVSLELIAPPGPSGDAAIRVKRAGTIIIPFNNYGWLTLDDEKITFPINTEMTATGVTLEGYNNGRYDHTFYARAIIRDLPHNGAMTPAAPKFIPNVVLRGMVVA